MINISSLWVYPIKSMSGICLEKSVITSKGLKYDRQWMLIDKNKHFITQRQFPKMALFNVSLNENGLSVEYPDIKGIFIPFIDSQLDEYETLNVKVWNDYCDAISIDTEFDQWFSQVLGQECQLVYMPETTHRQVDTHYANNNQATMFADGFPFLLASDASLSDLNSRLQEKGNEAINMQHFRPNIVLTGCEPYDEDSWSHFKINSLLFDVVKPCTRCVITTINPCTGEKMGKEPLATLYTYRKQGSQVIFGQNVLLSDPLTGEKDMTISVGDLITF